jgi:hypothetical protein
MALALSAVSGAQEGAPATSQPVDEEIIVVGRALRELRFRIERAENDVYARFNEINSNDLYDMHCYERPPGGSRMVTRRCLSNAWRKADIAFADATVRDLQSSSVAENMSGAIIGGAGYSHIPQQYRAKQLRTEGLVIDEMRRLAGEDPILREAMARLGQAYHARGIVADDRSDFTLYRELTPGDESLAFGARRVVEVQIGSSAWTHSLAARTFTLARVDGRIRAMHLACDATETRLEYEEALDWTIPPSWGACRLEVDAKRGTTFAFYEFD